MVKKINKNQEKNRFRMSKDTMIGILMILVIVLLIINFISNKNSPLQSPPNPTVFGHSLGEIQTCAEGQTLKMLNGAWTCFTPTSGLSCTTVTTNQAQTLAIATCPTGYTVTGGSCQYSIHWEYTGANQVSGNGWYYYGNTAPVQYNYVIATAICCK